VLEAGSGSGADQEAEFVPVEREPLPVGAVPGDSAMPSICPAPNMAASMPSGSGVVGPVALVVKEVVLGVDVAIGVALPRKRYQCPNISQLIQKGGKGSIHSL
jgi:hypothetical protein